MKTNLTVHHLTYNDVDSSLCLFGGFAVFNEGNSLFKETFSSCKSHIYDSRSFYSTNSSPPFIIYMYEQYSSINISYTISTVKCKPVMMFVKKIITVTYISMYK